METAQKVEKVNELRKQGRQAKEACKEVGITYPTYSYHHYKSQGPARAKKSKPRVLTMPVPEPAGIITLQGTAAEIGALITTIARGIIR